MSKRLQELIERARTHRVTDEERQEQVRSFAFGNTHFENESITRSDIDQAMISLRAERDNGQPAEPVRS